MKNAVLCFPHVDILCILLQEDARLSYKVIAVLNHVELFLGVLLTLMLYVSLQLSLSTKHEYYLHIY